MGRRVASQRALRGLELPTILVADDNSNIQKMVSLAFEEHGIDVVAVGNGEAAVRRMPDLNPDLVLADVFMPVRNGYEVCEFVKKDPRFSKVPVILLVGAFDPLDENEARRVGADGVLKKPFVPPDPLIAMVTSALEKVLKAEPVPQAVASVAEVMVPRSAPPPAPFVVPEPEPEPEGEVYAYGTGRRDLDEEPQELSAPLRTTTEEEEAPEEEPESQFSETPPDWRRRAASLEVPENTGDDSAAATIETPLPEFKEERAESVTFEAPAKREETPSFSPPPPFSEETSEAAKSRAESKPAVSFPHVSSQGSRSSTIEWMEMMAPAPPPEHTIAWAPPPESQVKHEPADTASSRVKEAPAEMPPAREVAESFFSETPPPPPAIPPHVEGESEIFAHEQGPITEATPAVEESFFAPTEAAPEVSSGEPEFSHVDADSFFTPDEDFHRKPSAAPVFSSPAQEAAREEKVEEAPSPALADTATEAPSEPVTAVGQPLDPPFPAQETPLLAAPVSADFPQSSEAHATTAPPEMISSAPAEETAPSEASENANIETLVTRVLEKLEPRLHELLSNGVLRPLVEGVLQKELKKKQ